MRRRKKAYVIKSSRFSARSAKVLISPPKEEADFQEIVEKPFRPIPHILQGTSELDATAALSPLSSPHQSQPLQPEKTNARTQLRWVTGVNAILSWAASIIGYLDIRDYNEERGVEDRDGERLALWGISLLQVALIFVYNVKVLQQSEFLRRAYNRQSPAVPTFMQCPGQVRKCVLEAGFHLLLMPPRICVQGTFHQMRTSALLSLSDLFYIFILLRNYHTVRFFYWCSRFSTPRSHAFLSFGNQRVAASLKIKSCTAAYSLKLILILFGAFVIFSGLILFSLEKGTENTQFGYVQNSLSALAVLHTTVGYGDVVPSTLFGQLAIVVNCLLGSCLVALITSSSTIRLALSRPECALYSELAYMRYIRKHRKSAAVLIQRWWKLMEMRQKRTLNGFTIVNFYSYMRTHRRVLTAANGKKDRNFDLQISSFSASTSKKCKILSDYLQPIELSRSFVLFT